MRRARQFREAKPPSSQKHPANGNNQASLVSMDLWSRFKLLCGQPVNGASLAIVRIALGLVMVLEVFSLCHPSGVVRGKIPLETYYVGPDIKFHFPYDGFGWLPVLPTPWIYGLLGVLALAGLAMAAGLCYRISAVTIFLAWGYLFAIESTRTYFQSYYYLELLFAFLMIWVPAARRYSVDAWRARHQDSPRTVPFWTIILLRGQLVIAYFYGGVAKMNLDWLLDAAPVRWDLQDVQLANASLAGILHSPKFAYLIAYAGAAFDLSIGFLLLFRRTRIFGMILMVLFHATNHFIIFDNIDWFPLVGVATATVFLDPDWPERFWNWLKRPQFRPPDWGWLGAGGIIFPLVGAALGWKLKASAPPAETENSRWLGRFAAPFVVAWLTFQAFLPIRHYLIPGDGRFTSEGISFSWRLKADDRRALGFQMFIKDPKIIPREETGHARIAWNEWHGEKVLYRRVTPGQIDWTSLPEIVVLLEPIIGERIFYNPYAGNTPTEAQSRERVNRIWQEVYGRQPDAVHSTLPLFPLLPPVESILRAGGQNQEAMEVADLVSRSKLLGSSEQQAEKAAGIHRDFRGVLDQIVARNEGVRMLSPLRRLNPFVLEGERSRSFLLVEDSMLFGETLATSPHINRNAWKAGAQTRTSQRAEKVNELGDPLVIWTSEIGREGRQMLPQACLFDSLDHPEKPPYIWWNTPKDLNHSKFAHVSNQPFYLRRYALRVASLWEKEYGRRPVVQAKTAVSLNGRPYQLLVDPAADLATVPASWVMHNPWINDLETPRIPREALVRPRRVIGL